MPGVRADVRTALLDIDGTLVASNDAHAHAWIDALTEAGFGIPFERVRPLIGMGADQLLPALNRGLIADAAPGKTIARRRGEIFKKRYLADIKPQRGARELLITLRDAGVACVVATSGADDEIAALLEAGGIADLIQTKTTAEDAEASKPAPDIINAALKKSGAKPDECVLLGDTRFDISAATKAGVQTIALRCGGSAEGDLLSAAAIYDDPAALSEAIRVL